MAIADALLSLVIEADRATPKAPAIAGPAADALARELFHELQAGLVTRARLSADFNAYLDDARLEAAAPRLAAMGEPKRVELVSARERGGMEVARVRFVFASETIRALLYRTPEGTIHEFLLARGS
jgi:hypothetical protein